MKTLIAAAMFISSSYALALSFDYEKAVDSTELYSTLASDGTMSVDADYDANFTYQKVVGSADLFPTLQSAEAAPQSSPGRIVFEYQRTVDSQELDPSLSF